MDAYYRRWSSFFEWTPSGRTKRVVNEGWVLRLPASIHAELGRQEFWQVAFVSTLMLSLTPAKMVLRASTVRLHRKQLVNRVSHQDRLT